MNNFQKMNSFNDKKIDYLDSYNVVLSTSSYYSTSGDNNNITYAFDWSVLPDQPYNVHFSYLGGVNNLTGVNIANLYIDFGANSNTFQAGNNINALNTQFIGVLKPYVLGGSSFLLAEDGTNPPIYISGRPTNNIFTVEVRDNTGALYVPTTGTLAEYRLNLKFIPVKNFLAN